MAETQEVEPAVEDEGAEPDIVDAEVVEDETEALAEMEEAEQSREIVIREKVTVDPATMPTPREWDAMRAMAETVCKTEFVPSTFRNRPEAALAAILSGRELGIGPMQSLKDISIIDGRPALSAHLMLALLRKGGVKIVASESTNEVARITARRRDTGEEATVEWTLEEARQADLSRKTNWTKYPADMLWARAVGRLGRRLGSDLLAGMPYTAEEVRDFDSDLDDPTGYSTAPMTAVRQEGPPEYPLPKNWKEIELGVKACDNSEEAWALFQAFTRAASYFMFGTTDTKTLKKDEKDTLYQKAAGVTAKLHKDVPITPPEFTFFTEDEQRKAWSWALGGGDGTKLEIPDYEPPKAEEKPDPDEEREREADAAAQMDEAAAEAAKAD